MHSAPGADPVMPPREDGLSAAGGDFVGALTRYLRALTGLLGLEMRESGAQGLILASLAVGFIVACFFAYFFLVLAVTVGLTLWLGGGWLYSLGGLCLFHLLLAGALLLALTRRAQMPLFPGTREAMLRVLEGKP